MLHLRVGQIVLREQRFDTSEDASKARHPDWKYTSFDDIEIRRTYSLEIDLNWTGASANLSHNSFAFLSRAMKSPAPKPKLMVMTLPKVGVSGKPYARRIQGDYCVCSSFWFPIDMRLLLHGPLAAP